MKNLFLLTAIAVLTFAAGCTTASDTNTFLREAAHGGRGELEMAKLAAERGQSELVKIIAARIVEDHAKTEADLKQTAAAKNFTLPTDLSPKHRAAVEKLQKLSGAEFDAEFVNTMISHHDYDINLYATQATSGTDAPIKEFASRTLPTLQKHLQTLKEIKGGLKK